MEKHEYINPNLSNTDKQAVSENDDDDSSSAGTDPPPTGILGSFVKYAERGSMTGVPYIHQSKNIVVKIIWSCLLLAACACMTFHLYKLFSTYFEYKKQTQIQLSFSSLQFPAVTICNANPFRLSQKSLASQNMKKFLEEVALDSLSHELDDWKPDFEIDDSFDSIDQEYHETEDSQDNGRNIDWSARERKRRQTRDRKPANLDNRDGVRSTIDSKSSSEAKNKEKKRRNNNFFDDLDLLSNVSDHYPSAIYDVFAPNKEITWEAESSPSGFYEIERKFRHLFASEPLTVRARMGHQMSDMLLQCSFAGRKCITRNFTRLLTTRYGNCYTLEYPKFVSRRSGPSDGLQLKLFLETDEYIPGLATSKGVQVVIHDQGTLPFPDDEGIGVKAGSAAAISFRRVEVNRLGEPYDHCTPVDDFKRKYGVKYTRTTCQKICQQVRTREKCGCYDIMEQGTHTVVKVPRNLKPCTSKKELECVLNIALRFEKESDKCGCYRPCQETTFDKTVSFRSWPNRDFAKILSTAACKGGSSVCNGTWEKEGIDLREEFVKLDIYYEDLNYEELIEQADYELDQFMSDVGGTIGLWIGLSILSVFEIFHLLTDICLYLCCKRRKQ